MSKPRHNVPCCKCGEDVSIGGTGGEDWEYVCNTCYKDKALLRRGRKYPNYPLRDENSMDDIQWAWRSSPVNVDNDGRRWPSIDGIVAGIMGDIEREAKHDS